MRGCSVAHVERLALVPTEFRELRGVQPMAGRFEVRDDEIVFFPRFPPIGGTSYSLLLDGADVATIVVPQRAVTPVARVRSVFPSTAELPFNQLKLYLEFAHPMSEGWATRAIEVRRAADAQLVPGVFLPMEPELWDPGRQRLTVLLDPGRIKRGLAPNAEAGYPLEEGVPIVIVVERGFRDAEGRPLIAGAARTYRVGPAVRTRVDPSRWSVRYPRLDTRDPLVVDFDRPLDRGLLEHCLVVMDTLRSRLEGRMLITPGERRWSFTPSWAWRAGDYQLVVDARLEDLAGNSLTRVFDRDLTRLDDAPTELDRRIVEFRLS